MSPKKVGILAASAVALTVVLSLAGQLLETNNQGFYQIKQAAITGTMSVINKTGTYFQLFGDVHTYKLSDTFFFDGTEGSTPISVRFQDGGTANIHGSLKYRLSNIENDQLALHTDFRSDNAVKLNLVAPIVKEALKQSSPFMDAEDSYSTKRSAFTALIEDQITKGIFDTLVREEKQKDKQGNEFIEKWIEIKRTENGEPVLRKPSPFNNYNIEVVRFVITNIDYDSTIDALIAKKKEAEQQKVVARANAEKAKQDAVTALEEGKAKVAIAKAKEEVVKIQAVTQAEKEKAVAILDAEKNFEAAKLARKQAAEDAKARLIKQKAEADANRLLVTAGLTPQERAEWRFKTEVGVAEQLSKVKFPGMMILGGGSNGKSAMNPFDAVGLESFIKIQKSLSSGK